MIRMLRVMTLGFALLAPAAARASDNADHAAIRGVMKGTWDKPDSPVAVGPIVVRGDHALAGWTQGEMGGRALLRRKASQWSVIFCAGDDLKRADILHRIGLPQADADAVAAMLAAAEKAADPSRVAMFSRFEGLVQVSGEDSAAQTHNGAAHPAPAHAPPHGHAKGH
ncbi:MAG: copper uptake system-associated protein [Pseudorhodoplanes sp.]|nr:copper uptake system-associated protein [Pseudorhodoplanes sp.]